MRKLGISMLVASVACTRPEPGSEGARDGGTPLGAASDAAVFDDARCEEIARAAFVADRKAHPVPWPDSAYATKTQITPDGGCVLFVSPAPGWVDDAGRPAPIDRGRIVTVAADAGVKVLGNW